MEIFVEISPNLNKEVELGSLVHKCVFETDRNSSNHNIRKQRLSGKKGKRRKNTIRKQNRFIRRRVVTTEIKCK